MAHQQLLATPPRFATPPRSKPPQEVERRKQAAREAEALKGDVARLKQQLAAAKLSEDDLQRANGELRQQLHQLRDAAAAAAAATAGGGGASAGAVAAAALRRQVEQLQGALQQREEETGALREAVEQLRRQLTQRGDGVGGRGGEGGERSGGAWQAGSDGGGGGEVGGLQKRVEVLERENAELREELGAFDSEFWDELEELVSLGGLGRGMKAGGLERVEAGQGLLEFA